MVRNGIFERVSLQTHILCHKIVENGKKWYFRKSEPSNTLKQFLFPLRSLENLRFSDYFRGE